MATIRDVAKLAGVSISTVSLTFSGAGPVGEETRQRIRSAAKQVGYTASPLGRSLARGHSDLIGMVVAEVSNPFFGTILREVEDRALELGHMVIVSDTDAKPDRELAILDRLSALRVAGVIYSPHGQSEEFVQHVRSLSIPLVTIDHKLEGLEVDFVSSDNLLASAMLTEHIIRLGHKRIAHIAGRKGLWTAEQRKLGFRNTMMAAGIEIDETLVVEGNYVGRNAYECTMRLLTRADPPTAIIAANNVMALGALQAMNDLGVPCPGEVSLASIDDVPWGEVIQPRLTMAVQPLKEIARIAMDYLLERINVKGDTRIEPRECILTPKLVIGQSCAPPSHQSPRRNGLVP
ncbi:LacI family transcriptional regulator [Rhizobium tibeticum]|uniref:LacI family DNA-binding transcriptional regulator n=1 Tax=Rhizobium tibeticum TaxID=501024 RepID=UPI00277EECAB|nr:LacI family DNA-binding transcriptional regulator [Rhizobium tibeticum]MDP9813798.1 LacI family transcriptional regulator [Rhizobium tibeticum]